MSDLWPVTVFLARYGGTYEGAPWVAINSRVTDDAMNGCQGDDITCATWFSTRRNLGIPVGRGDTPDEAVADLANQLGVAWKSGDDSLRVQFERALEKARERAERGECDD